MGKTVDGNGNYPSSHGIKIHTDFVIVLDWQWACSVFTLVMIQRCNEDFVTHYCNKTLVGSYCFVTHVWEWDGNRNSPEFNSRCRTFISVCNQPATQGQLSRPSLRGR